MQPANTYNITQGLALIFNGSIEKIKEKIQRVSKKSGLISGNWPKNALPNTKPIKITHLVPIIPGQTLGVTTF